MTDPAEGQPGVSLLRVLKRGRRKSTNPDEVAWLIANLKETITQQNDVIKNARTDIAEIKSEEQNLKNQNSELREETQSLRTELSAYSASLLPTRSWASVAESGASRPPKQRATNFQTENPDTFELARKRDPTMQIPQTPPLLVIFQRPQPTPTSETPS
ncbi:hypothetical protein V2W45_1340266 [Cenococcum geophilum]